MARFLCCCAVFAVGRASDSKKTCGSPFPTEPQSPWLVDPCTAMVKSTPQQSAMDRSSSWSATQSLYYGNRASQLELFSLVRHHVVVSSSIVSSVCGIPLATRPRKERPYTAPAVSQVTQRGGAPPSPQDNSLFFRCSPVGSLLQSPLLLLLLLLLLLDPPS